jgi:hypothetical protein
MTKSTVSAADVLKWALGEDNYSSTSTQFRAYADAITNITHISDYQITPGMGAFLASDPALQSMIQQFKDQHEAEYELFVEVNKDRIDEKGGLISYLIGSADPIQDEIKIFIESLGDSEEKRNEQLKKLFPLGA